MKKKNIIALAGDLASGKGTVSEILIKDLNYGIYRNGEYARKLAKDMGLDITSFNAFLAEHPEIDLQIEKSASEYAKNHDIEFKNIFFKKIIITNFSISNF